VALDKSLVEAVMEKVLEVLRSDEVLASEIRAFRLCEPLKLVEFPLLYVEFSPSSGEEFAIRSSGLYERRIRLDVCVVDRHVEPEKADIKVFRLAERVCRTIASNPRLDGLVEDTVIEKVLPGYGVLGDHAISQARITLLCRVMWRA